METGDWCVSGFHASSCLWQVYQPIVARNVVYGYKNATLRGSDTKMPGLCVQKPGQVFIQNARNEEKVFSRVSPYKNFLLACLTWRRTGKNESWAAAPSG
jgi:hypothetical protein